MSLFSYDKLIEDTRRRKAEFRRTTGTILPVSGENVRHNMWHHLDRELSKKHSAGIDVIGRNARERLQVQIKSRASPHIA